MKKNICIILPGILLIILLLFPDEALSGSADGLLLWFHTVLPTLLPFLILTNLIIRLDAVVPLVRLVSPVFRILFSLSPYGSYALLTGLICGYPMGAKITADLLRSEHLSEKEASFLLGICNNVSPMFLLGYVITQSLQCPQHKYALLLFVYGTPLMYAFFTKPSRQNAQNHSLKVQKASVPFTFQIVDDSIMNGFETVTRIGGYIILFAIISKMATARLHAVTILKHSIIGFIEITNGIHSIGTSSVPVRWQLPLATAVITFGGLSGLAQTKSMIQQTSLSIRHYIITRIKLTVFATLAALVYCLLFIA